MSAPTIISTATLTFGEDSYKVKSIPAGKPQSCEAVDVTCCDDSVKKFAPGKLTVNGEISIVIAGNVAPTVGEIKNLSLVLSSGSIACGKCGVKASDPSTIEADNARERTWTVVFQPTGEE